MQAHLKVRRFDRTREPKEWWQEYTVEVEHYHTVLDTLIAVREYQDETLAVRCSCRGAICGSCAMRVNGQAKLVCKTKLVDVGPEGETVTVEPAGVMPALKDLVVDMSVFWEKIRAVKPWLQPAGPPPDGREYLVDNESMQKLVVETNCIMCGACVSDCTVLEVDDKFLGPAALAKAMRFIGDPRDAAGKERLRRLVEEGGVWDCTHCFECVEVCPKHVAPMERIIELRQAAVEAGFTDSNGARHAVAAEQSVEHSGWLDETTFIPKSYGWNLIKLLPQVPTALRALLKGKLPSPIHPPIPGVENVQRIFRKFHDKQPAKTAQPVAKS